MIDSLQKSLQGELESRMTGWIRVRLISAIFLFLLSLFFRPTLPLPYPNVPILTLVLLLCGVNSAFYLLRSRKNLTSRLVYLQIAIDLLVITAIFQYTGGVDSPFNWFYLLLIVAVGLVGGFKMTIVVTICSIALYALILWGQYTFLFAHYHVGHLATHADAGFRDMKLLTLNLLANSFGFLALGVVSGYVAELAERRKRQITVASKLYNEAVVKNVTVAQEEERKRIARELHDETTQSLTFLLLNLQSIEEDATLPSHLKDKMRTLQTLATSLIDGLRTAISNLRPTVLDDLGLLPALKWFLKNHIEPLDIKWTLLDFGKPRRLADTIEISLYRLLQEAVTNVVKHASAKEVMIIFRFEESRIKILVQDDGAGFQPNSLPETDRWGIAGMRERVTLLGGKLDISSAQDEGTTLKIDIPC